MRARLSALHRAMSPSCGTGECFIERGALGVNPHSLLKAGKAPDKFRGQFDEPRSAEKMQCGETRSVFAHPSRPFAAHIDRCARAVGGIHKQLNRAMDREVFSNFLEWSVTELTDIRAFEGQQDRALARAADGQRTVDRIECDSLRNAHAMCVANFGQRVEKANSSIQNPFRFADSFS